MSPRATSKERRTPAARRRPASPSGGRAGASRRGAASPRQRALAALRKLDRVFGEVRTPETGSVLEKAAYLVLREGATHDAAMRALKTLRDDFVDWNEVRTSRPSELARMIVGTRRASAVRKLHDRARRVRDLIDQVYNERNEPSMEFVIDMKAKERFDYLVELDGLGPHNGAALMQWLSGEQRLGPITPSFAKAAQKLGLLDSAAVARVRKDLGKVVEPERLVALQAHFTQLGELEEPWPAAVADLLA